MWLLVKKLNYIYEIIIIEKARNNVWQYLYMSKRKKLTEGGGGGGEGEGGNGENFPIVITSSRCKLFCGVFVGEELISWREV